MGRRKEETREEWEMRQDGEGERKREMREGERVLCGSPVEERRNDFPRLSGVSVAHYSLVSIFD